MGGVGLPHRVWGVSAVVGVLERSRGMAFGGVHATKAAPGRGCAALRGPTAVPGAMVPGALSVRRGGPSGRRGALARGARTGGGLPPFPGPIRSLLWGLSCDPKRCPKGQRYQGLTDLGSSGSPFCPPFNPYQGEKPYTPVFIVISISSYIS